MLCDITASRFLIIVKRDIEIDDREEPDDAARHDFHTCSKECSKYPATLRLGTLYLTVHLPSSARTLSRSGFLRSGPHFEEADKRITRNPRDPLSCTQAGFVQTIACQWLISRDSAQIRWVLLLVRHDCHPLISSKLFSSTAQRFFCDRMPCLL